MSDDNQKVLEEIRETIMGCEFKKYTFEPMDESDIIDSYRSFLSNYFENFDIVLNGNIITVSIPYSGNNITVIDKLNDGAHQVIDLEVK
jgi:hypothetical protein